MTLKDFLRILRRRIIWFLAVFTIGVAIYGYARVSEKEFYTSMATVKIEAPESITVITQSPQRAYYTPATTYNTWQALITRKDVKADVLKKLKLKFNNLDNGVLNAIFVESVSNTLFTHIFVTTESKDLSVQVVNTIAEVAAETSKAMLTEDLSKSLTKLNKDIEENDGELGKYKKQRDDLQKEAGIINIDKKVDELYNSIGDLTSQIRTIDNGIKRNNIGLEKLNKDKVAASHLSLQGITTTAKIYKFAMPSSSLIDSLESKILQLRFSFNEQAKRYTPENPILRDLKKAIKEAEVELSQEREKLLGSYLDKEELRLSNEIELSTLEKKSLEQTLEERQKEYGRLTDIYRKYDSANRQFSEVNNRNLSLIDLKKQILLKKEGQSGYITTYEPAVKEDAQVADKKTTKVLPMAILISLIAALAAVYTAELLDTTIKTDYDVRRHLNYQLLGIIPILKKEDVILLKGKEVSVLYELFDTVVTMIYSLGAEKPIKSVLITSTNPEEGKTTIAINLATAIARQGKKTLVIDGDLRIPNVHSFLNLDNSLGFSELLLGTHKVTDINSFESIAKEAGLENLKAITSGKSTDNPYSLLEPQKVASVVDNLKQFTDYIVLDSPPVLRTGDALKLASVADAVILIVEGGKTDQKEATWAKHLIENVGATVVGVILNKATTAREQYYYYYYYSYGGKYGKYHRTNV